MNKIDTDTKALKERIYALEAENRRLRRLLAAAELAELPLMALRPNMPEEAERATYTVDGKLLVYMRPGQDCCGRMKAVVYRIADTDEHGLPVIPREKGMPSWAKYRFESTLGGNSWFTYESGYHVGCEERIEDFNPNE